MVNTPETIGARSRELRVGPCGALTWTVPGLAGEVGCVRGQALPCIEQQDWAGGFSQKEKDPGGTLGNSPAAAVPVSSPPSCLSKWGCGGHQPTSKAWGECKSEGPETTGTEDSANQGRPHARTHSPQEGECLNMWVQGTLESWARGCSSVSWDGEELG